MHWILWNKNCAIRNRECIYIYIYNIFKTIYMKFLPAEDDDTFIVYNLCHSSLFVFSAYNCLTDLPHEKPNISLFPKKYIQSCVVITRSNITWYCTYHGREWDRISISGELWGVFRECFGENWPPYNGTVMYCSSIKMRTLSSYTIYTFADMKTLGANGATTMISAYRNSYINANPPNVNQKVRKIDIYVE